MNISTATTNDSFIWNNKESDENREVMESQRDNKIVNGRVYFGYIYLIFHANSSKCTANYYTELGETHIQYKS